MEEFLYLAYNEQCCYMYLCKFFCGCIFLFSLDIYLGAESLNRIVTLWLAFKKLPEWLQQFTSLPVMHEGSNFSIFFLTLVIYYACFGYNHPSGYEVKSLCGFI